jgi:hypothetical protein
VVEDWSGGGLERWRIGVVEVGAQVSGNPQRRSALAPVCFWLPGIAP